MGALLENQHPTADEDADDDDFLRDLMPPLEGPPDEALVPVEVGVRRQVQSVVHKVLAGVHAKDRTLCQHALSMLHARACKRAKLDGDAKELRDASTIAMCDELSGQVLRCSTTLVAKAKQGKSTTLVIESVGNISRQPLSMHAWRRLAFEHHHI